MQVQKFGGPLKNLEPKNIQNLDRFYTTSDFDRKYLRNETRYQKSERYVISNDSSHVQPNKSGELWSTIHKVVHVSLDPPKSTFSGDYISASTACLRKKNKQDYFCYNYVKLPPNLTIFGTKMSNRLKVYEVHSFSTLSNSCHCTTVLNADVPNCYITL